MSFLSSKMKHYSFSPRLKNWSAPSIFSLLIIICMFIIYCSEKIGLAHRERNLFYRISKYDDINYNRSENDLNKKNSTIKQSFKDLMKKERILRKQKIQNIIQKGMIDQLLYESRKEQRKIFSIEIALNTYDKDIQIFDI